MAARPSPSLKRWAFSSVLVFLGIQGTYFALSFSPHIRWSNNTPRNRFGVLSRTRVLSRTASSSSSGDLDVEEDGATKGRSSSTTWDWRDTAQSVFDGEDQRPVILFDGVCNLCNGGVNFALDRDPVGYFRFASLQSKIGKSLLLRSNKDADDVSSIVLVDAETSYFKSEAVLRIAQKLDGPFSKIMGFGGLYVPGFVRNIVYDFVADNRYRLGKREDSCRLEDEQFDGRFVPDPAE